MATFAEIATGDKNFSILVGALTFIDERLPGSNLVATLADGNQNLTVFAPTNAAFGRLAQDLGYIGDPADTPAVTKFIVENVPVETLNTVILYHLSSGAQTASDIAGSGSVSTLQGGTIGATELPTLTDAEPDLIDPSLVATDIAADNGVLHVIDRVLLPIDLPDNDAPSITAIVETSGEGFDANSADFDILLAALKTAGLAGALDDATADLTVFAPTDAAFVGLAQQLGYQSEDESGAWGYLVEALTLLGGGDPIPLLTQVLTYHVSGQSLQASQVLGSDAIATLQGGTIGVNGTTLVDQDPDIANPNLIATDIQASNGVVHVIDAVLLPADLLASNGSNDVDFVIGNDRSERFFTGADNDFVSGNGGSDLIFSGSGNDVILGGDGRDKLFAGRGDDIAQGGEGRDVIYGGSGNDILGGGAGKDVIFGGSGNDTITGGAGHDTMYGGRGEDTFVFNTGDGHDRIIGFNTRQDKIDLSSLGLDGIDDLDIGGRFFRTVIRTEDGDTINLFGVNESHLTEDNFIF